MSILTLDNLTVTAPRGPIVEGVSLSIDEGEIVCLVGESGSGKTTTALAAFGWAAPGLRVSGTVQAGREHSASPAALRGRRGSFISYVPQNPGTALNPAYRVADALQEMLRREHDRASAGEAVRDSLELVGLPSERQFARRYPHQLSGGQQQRVCIAAALAMDPEVIVLDEPTTGLDVVTQGRILDELLRLRRQESVAMLYITHDLAVAARIADRIVVMYQGRIVEQGPAARVLVDPEHEYTRSLMAATPDHRIPRETGEPVAVPHVPSDGAGAPGGPVLTVTNLKAVHRTRSDTVVAAEDVSFSVGAGKCLALVGESGSGKTTIARSIAGLHGNWSGSVRAHGRELAHRARKRTREQLRAVQMVFQNPTDTLNPRITVGDSIAASSMRLRGLSRRRAQADAVELLEAVRLTAAHATRYPHELSGGQRQRVAIARALAAHPDLIVCDEVTSSLDVSVQAVVLDVLDELRRSEGLSLLFITHDLGVVSAIADEVIVLDHGFICESGPTRAVLDTPREPYTRQLLAAAPSLSEHIDQLRAASGGTEA